MSKKRNPKEIGIILFQIITPLLILILTIFSGWLFYQMPDDEIMNFINIGEVTNASSSHVVFSHIVYGKIAELLGKLYNGINWYGLIYIFSIIFIVYSTIVLFNRYTNKIISLFIGLSVEALLITMCSFTVFAYVGMGIAVIACMDFVISDDTRKKKVLKIIHTAFLFLNGYFFRPGALTSLIVLAAPIGLYIILQKKIKKTVEIGAVILVLIITFSFLENRAYDSPFWQNYKEINHYRSNIQDFPDQIYADNESGYKKIGISENDFDCLNTCMFADKEIYNAETLKDIHNISAKSDHYILDIKEIIKQLIEKKKIFLMIFLLLLFALLTKKKYFFILQILVELALEMALIIRNRYVVRVEVPIYFLTLLFVSIVLFIEIKDGKKQEEKLFSKQHMICISSLAVIMAILLVPCMKLWKENSAMKINNKIKYDKVLKYTRDSKDTIYLTDALTRNEILFNEPLISFGKNITSANIMHLGDWDIYNDLYYVMEEKYKFKYPDRLLIDVAENDNIRVIFKDEDTKKLDMLTTYIKCHTSQNIKTEKIKSFDKEKISVYNISYME